MSVLFPFRSADSPISECHSYHYSTLVIVLNVLYNSALITRGIRITFKVDHQLLAVYLMKYTLIQRHATEKKDTHSRQDSYPIAIYVFGGGEDWMRGWTEARGKSLGRSKAHLCDALLNRISAARLSGLSVQHVCTVHLCSASLWRVSAVCLCGAFIQRVPGVHHCA